jgi:dihydroorotate dehydrogenase (NAD+) catalytic subunit
MVYEVTQAVKACCQAPLIVKLTPNTTDIRETAAAAESAGCDALSLINTVLGMAIDIRTQKPLLGNVVGGLSGPAVKPIALRMVYEVSRKAKIPIIGMGGIMTAEDAVEFLLAGASAVAVGTAGLVTPTAWTDIAAGLEDYMRTQGIEKISSLIGALKVD